jgi:hypothetical protein
MLEIIFRMAVAATITEHDFSKTGPVDRTLFKHQEPNPFW